MSPFELAHYGADFLDRDVFTECLDALIAGLIQSPSAYAPTINKEKAIAHASQRAVLGVFPEDAAWLNEQMRGLGYDPDNDSTDATLQGVEP